uniref:Uncharacterized protein n=1 Tax=Anopheles atroparvus TaxID=41427 RepID=A0AAG5DIL9_ANOAO
MYAITPSRSGPAGYSCTASERTTTNDNFLRVVGSDRSTRRMNLGSLLTTALSICRAWSRISWTASSSASFFAASASSALSISTSTIG